MGRLSRTQGDDDLFSRSLDGPRLEFVLARMRWPDAQRFPVNYAGSRVRDTVWGDLTSSRHPMVVAGWASIEQVIRLVADLSAGSQDKTLRVVFGTEPFASERTTWPSAAVFTEQARKYWADNGVSILQSAKIIQAIDALDAGWFEARFIPGRTRLHAKIYLGDAAAVVGSSNFTETGLSRQFEANARFLKRTEPEDYGGVKRMAENYWDVGDPWNEQLRGLLRAMTKVVTWQEALARACATLLEGQWADLDLGILGSGSSLWPHQRSGIAQALWVIENVGSVLVADPTGSGKTRMGAHLIHAVRDRLLSTGRIRDGLCTLVCPGPVKEAWDREALACRLPLLTVSDGLLSRSAARGRRVEEEQVAEAQILALDEGHRFLNHKSNRSLQVGLSNADHVIMFTATPINREARDLLAHVDRLGADNFPDDLLKLLRKLNRRTRRVPLTVDEQDLLRSELQRFIVRRTKSQLNETVEGSPDDYRDPETGRICRYPQISPQPYSTGGTEGDLAIAMQIRELARRIRGVADLAGATITKPEQLSHRPDSDALAWRLLSAQGLTRYRLSAALRSSRAALLEHLTGTSQACREMGIPKGLVKKPADTGNVIDATERAKTTGPPTCNLQCPVPAWLTDPNAWKQACDQDLEHYQEIRDLASGLSSAREDVKVELIRDLAVRHERVLVFEYKPITAALIKHRLDGVCQTPVLLATGGAAKERLQVQEHFRPDATDPAIAVCTDALNEGLNLQGASTMVHLDYPTTLRVAEQRVGRIVRMNSRHDRIQTWWPVDPDEFKLRTIELIHRRHEESASLLGGNLDLPVDNPDQLDVVADTREFVERERSLSDEDSWEGIAAALDPVRRLVTGVDALVPPNIYAAYRASYDTVRARVSLVPAQTPWAFFAIEAPGTGAPRWMLLENERDHPHIQIEEIAHRLRELLGDNPDSVELNDNWDHQLESFLRKAARAERELLPRKLQRALDQMHETCRSWAAQQRLSGQHDAAERWEAIAALSRADLDDDPTHPSVDLYQVATLWLQLVQPYRAEARTDRTVRARRYSLLSDIDTLLKATPLTLDSAEATFQHVQQGRPLDRRITSCVLGIPRPSPERPS